MKAPDTPGSPQASHRAIMLVLAYLPPFAVIPLLVEKDDPDLHWHAKHGVVLMTAEMLLLLALVVVALVFGLLTAGIGCALLALVPIPFLAFLVLHVVIVIKAFNGHRLLIPIVSDYADKF
ncbi:MAG TPA: hypothetical protein VGK32_16260 [Vicinamibacterales bacterium]|jgi:uncharacterized membrane protein